MNERTLSIDLSEEDLITIVYALSQLNRTSTFASLRNKSEQLISYLNKNDVSFKADAKYRIINLKGSSILKGIGGLKDGDIVHPIKKLESGNWYVKEGYIIEPCFLEPYVNTLFDKAEQLWQTLAYANQMAKDGLPVDTEKISEILETNRPALTEK